MKLSEWVRFYRVNRGFSLQELADAWGISKPYIALIERGFNPQTGKPVVLSEGMIKKIAAGTGRSLMELAKEVDDIDLTLVIGQINNDEAKILSAYRNLNLTDKQLFRRLLSAFLVQPAGAVDL